MSNMDLVLIGFFQPTLDILRKSGVQIDELLEKSGLNNYNLNNSDAYVPLSQVAYFLDIASHEVEQNLSILFRGDLKLANAGYFGEDTVHSSDLLSAINYGVKYNQNLLTISLFSFSVDGVVTTVQQRYLNKPQSGVDEIELIEFMLLYDGLTIAAGPNWSPFEIRIQGAEIPDFDRLVPNLCGTKVYFNQPVTSVSFPTNLLPNPMMNNDKWVSRRNSVGKPEEKMTQRLELLMDSSIRKIDLAAASKVMDVSERTLKRYIKDEGATYKQVVEQWRFKKAITLLHEPDKTINEISYRLHYSNPSNFIRAFKGWTGKTPMHYRGDLG